MPHYLIDTFGFNHWANDLALRAIENFTADKNLIGLFSDWITSQNKWMERVKGNSSELDAEVFRVPVEFERLIARWSEALYQWFDFWSGMKKPILQDVYQLKNITDKTLDSDEWREVVRQLKNHLIFHHRQIHQTIEARIFKLGQTDSIYQTTKNQSKTLNKKVTGVKIINDH